MPFIYSKFAADEDWQELLRDLVNDVPRRLETLDAAVASSDVESLSFLVHQLKGACGSYGYDEITPLASKLEAAIDENKDMATWQSELAKFRTALLSMTDQPQRACSTMSGSEN